MLTQPQTDTKVSWTIRLSTLDALLVDRKDHNVATYGAPSSLVVLAPDQYRRGAALTQVEGL
jgi:hypothetical protein